MAWRPHAHDRIDHGSLWHPEALCRAHRDARDEGRLDVQNLECRQGDRPGDGPRRSPLRMLPDELLITNPGLLGAAVPVKLAWFQGSGKTATACLDPIKFQGDARPGHHGFVREAGHSCHGWLRAYLDQRGIQVEKTTGLTSVPFLARVTKGKYGTLINALLHFKEDYGCQPRR